MAADSAWLALLTEPLAGLSHRLLAYLPDLAGAMAVVLGGWLVGQLLRKLIVRFGSGLEHLLAALQRRTGRSFLRLGWPIAPSVGAVVHGLMVLGAVTLGARLLGLDALAEWLADLFLYLPRILISVMMLVIGFIIAAMVRDTVAVLARTNGFAYGLPLGRISGVLVVIYSVLLALEQLGLDTTLLVNIVTWLAAALFGGTAISIGLGAADTVRNILAARYIRKDFRVGQRLRVAGFDGQILELTPVAVVLDMQDGTARVPARLFSEQVSVLLESEEGEP
jgi:hypothetical protein